MIVDQPTVRTKITIPNTGLHVQDTNASHDLVIVPGSDLTGEKTLTVITGDSNRTLTFTGDASIAGTNTGDVTLATDSGLAISSQVLNMGTPSTVTGASTNSVTTNTHTHAATGFEPTLTKGNLSEVTSAILTITGGTNAVIGAGTTIQVTQSDTTHNGYLSSTDWNTFNGKLTFSWATIAGTTQTAAVNTGYIPLNAGLTTITLPTTAAVGTIIRIAGLGTGGWKLAQNASQSVAISGATSTIGVGGFLASTLSLDSIELMCVIANLNWSAISLVGNITVN